MNKTMRSIKLIASTRDTAAVYTVVYLRTRRPCTTCWNIQTVLCTRFKACIHGGYVQTYENWGHGGRVYILNKAIRRASPVYSEMLYITSHHMEKTDAGLVASESEK